MEGETHIIVLEWKLGMWDNAVKEELTSPEHHSHHGGWRDFRQRGSTTEISAVLSGSCSLPWPFHLDLSYRFILVTLFSPHFWPNQGKIHRFGRFNFTHTPLFFLILLSNTSKNIWEQTECFPTSAPLWMEGPHTILSMFDTGGSESRNLPQVSCFMMAHLSHEKTARSFKVMKPSVKEIQAALPFL